MPQEGFFPEYIRHWLPTTDSPVLFHLAGALSVAACLLHRNVSLRHGATTVKLILWSVLLATSTRYRKSTAVNRAKDVLLVSPHGDVVLPENFTVASLLTQLGITAKTKMDLVEDMAALLKKQDAEPYNTTGVGFLGVDELGGLLAALNMDYNHGGKQLLTTLFDGENYTHTTKGAGCEGIPRPRLNILAASTLEWLSTATKQEDIGAGFYPRWLLFFARHSDYTLPLPDNAANNRDLLAGCVEKLVRLKDTGARTLGAAAEEYYVGWYNRLVANPAEEMGGWVHRLAIYALKVALLYEASTTNAQEVSLDNLRLATALIDRIAQDTATLLAEELGFSPDDAITKKVRKFIKEKKLVNWRTICARFPRDPAKVLHEAVVNLISQGLVAGDKGPKGGETFRWVE
jgi:hypothetical protein